MKKLTPLLFVLLLAGCATVKNIATVAYSAPIFTVQPHILQTGQGYFIAYQLDSTKNDMSTRRMLMHKIIKGQACYYFSGNVSFKEYKQLVKRQLPAEFVPFAETGKVYWLNPGKSLQLLRVDK